MGCTIKTKKGKISILADTLHVVFDTKMADYIYDKTRSFEFRKKMSGSKFVDKNGEAIPLFYVDKHKLNTTSVAEELANTNDSINYLTTDYTAALRNELNRPDVVFLNTIETSNVKGAVVPNLSYLTDSTKNAFGYSNTININNGQEVIVFDEEELIKLSELDSKEVNEYEEAKYAEITPATASDTVNTLTIESLNELLRAGIASKGSGFSIENDSEQTEEMKVTNFGKRIIISVNLNENKEKIFSTKPDLLAPLLRNVAKTGFVTLKRAISQSEYFKTIHSNNSGFSVFKLQDELVSSIVAAKFFIKLNPTSETSVKLQNELDKFDSSSEIEQGVDEVLYSLYGKLTHEAIDDVNVLVVKNDEATMILDNMFNTFSNRENLIHLKKQLSTSENEVKDNVIIKWQNRLINMLDDKLNKLNIIKLRFNNISAFDNEAGDNTKAIKDNLKLLTKQIDAVDESESEYKLLKAITANTIVDFKNMQLVQRYFDELDTIDTNKLDYAGKLDYAFKVNVIREVMSTISDISNFTEIKESILSNTSAYNIDEITRIKKHLSELDSLMKDANANNKRVTELSEMAMQLVLDDIESPDGRIVIKDSLFGISDLTVAQAQLDSLMDVNNPLAAMLKKNYQKYLFMKDKAVNKQQIEADNNLHKILGDMYNNKEAVIKFMDSILNEDNQLISDVDTSIDDERLERMNALSIIIRNTYNGSKAHKKAQFEFNDWYRKHYHTKFSDLYYDKMNSLSSESRDAIDELSARKREVTDAVKFRNNNIYDTDLLEENEKLQLDGIALDRKDLMASNEEVSKFYEDISDMVDVDNNKELVDAFSKVQKDRNNIRQKAWLLRNANLSDDFQEQVREKFDIIPNNKYNKYVSKLKSAIMNKVKDRDGLVNVDKLSEKDQADLRLLSKFTMATNKGDLVYKGDAESTPLSEYGAFRWTTDIVRNLMEGPVPPSYEKVEAVETSDSQEDSDIFKAISEAFDWLDSHTEEVASDYYIETRNRLQTDVSKEGQEAYSKWLNDNHVNGKPLQMWTKLMPKDVINNMQDLKGKSHFAGTSTYNAEYLNQEVTEGELNTLKTIKPNPVYEALNNKQKEMITYLNKTMLPLVNHLANTIYSKGALPSIENDESLSKKEKDKVTHSILKDTLGEDLRFIKFNELNLLNQKPVIRYRYYNDTELETHEHYLTSISKQVRDSYGIDLSEYVDDIHKAEQSKDEVVKAAAIKTRELVGESYTMMDVFDTINDEIRIENKKVHRESLDMDITKTLPAFIDNALTHKYKTKLESQLRLGLSMIKNATVQKTTGIDGTKVLNSATRVFNKITGKNELTEVVVEQTQSRLYERMKMDLEMIFYDNFTKPGNNNKYIEMARNYVSLNGIGFNPYSAIKNVAYGGLMMFTEAHAGYHFNKAQLRAGSAEYLRSFNELIQTVVNTQKGDKVQAKSLAIAMLSYFDILDTQIETDMIANSKGKKGYKHTAKNLIMLAAYGMQQAGESFMQHSALLAMTRSHRIIDGKVKSFEEYAMGKLKNYTVKEIRADVTKAEEINKENKEKVKELKKEFEKFDTLHDVSELVDGEYVANGVSDWELAEFRIKAQGVNQKIHGIYNKSDKGAIEHTMMGQLLMQFRHWMRPGWVKRYGSRGGFKTEKFWNVRRGEYDVGSWKVVRDFLKSPLSEGGLDFYLDGNERNARNNFVAISKAYLSFARNFKTHYGALNRQEQAEVRRIAAEMSALVIVAALAMTLAGLGDEDDEDSNFYNSIVYIANAVTIELTGFVPIYSWVGQTQALIMNPVAIMATVGKVATLLKDVLLYPIRNEDERTYQGGVYYKESKILVGIGKITPLVYDVMRYTHMARNQSTYKSQFLGIN